MFWRGLLGYLPANIVQGVVGVLTLLVFTRLLSAEDFGRYALAFSVMSIAHVAVFTWLEAAMARFWAAQEGPEAMARHFATLYRAFALLCLVFLPVAGLGLWLWPLETPLKVAIGVGLLGVPVRCAFRMLQERQRAEGAVAAAAGLDMAVTIGGFVVGLIAALMGLGGAAPLIGLAIAPFIAALIFGPLEARKGLGGVYERQRARDYATYGYPIAASLILALVLSSTDRLLLAAFLDEAAVGAYHAGYSLANRTLDVIFIWLGAAGGPALVMALERGGRPALQDAAREQGATFLLIALPAAAGLALVANPLAHLVIGEALREDAAAITPLIALSALLAGMTTYYFHQAFTLGRRTVLLLAAMAVPALANVVLNLILIPILGVTGAALATALSFGVGLLASMILGRRAIALPVPWSALGRCAAATLVMTGAVLLVPPVGGFAELAAKATVGAAVYGLCAWLLDAAGVRGHGSRVLKGLQARMAA
ncbi:lipopolysaccharide biosynthesis protein [Brevundimonas sp.]|uniref:lipopolysaccharide biosynthesis protein n=1 Tax=Brevundimonas sp. TaxID=1871086 RepID=UPI0025DC240F|nr:lipopolysaccharide biosynthesis protein [Brevundimonas sp.]